MAFREKHLEGMIAAEWDDEDDLEDARQAISALAALIGIAERELDRRELAGEEPTR